MQLKDLIKPLIKLGDECYYNEELRGYSFFFENFIDHFSLYVETGDLDSFNSVIEDEIDCLDEFPEKDHFMNESLMIIIDITEAVRLSYLNHDNNKNDALQIEYLLKRALENIQRITRQKKDPQLKN